jgi:hypothetical protein
LPPVLPSHVKDDGAEVATAVLCGALKLIGEDQTGCLTLLKHCLFMDEMLFGLLHLHRQGLKLMIAY